MIFWNFRYSGLTIKYVRGADPIIKLLDDDETVIEVQLIVHFFLYSKLNDFFLLFQTLAIERWNTDRSVILLCFSSNDENSIDVQQS